MKRFLMTALAATALLSTQASAQDFPNRPIHVLTTSSAGGISDLFMRVLSDEIGRAHV